MATKNSLVDLPAAFSQLPSIESVILDENDCSRIPAVLARIEIKELCMKGNALTTPAVHDFFGEGVVDS